MSRKFLSGLWRLADPKISITSLASMAIGASVAARDGYVSWVWLGVLGLAMFCMEVAKNAWGDVFDYDSGTDLAVAPEDRTSFSGGKRVMVDELLTRGQTWGIAIAFGLGGLVLGACMVFLKEFDVFWVGVVGFVLGWSYHGPPLRFAYRGLGELDVALCYGPIIATATYVLLSGDYSSLMIWLSVPLGVFISAFLWVNEFPDFDADRGAGKRNLVARLGKERAAMAYPFIFVLAAAVLVASVWAADAPLTVLFGLVALVPAAVSVYWVVSDPQGFHRKKPAQPAALFAFVIYSAGASIGVLIGG